MDAGDNSFEQSGPYSRQYNAHIQNHYHRDSSKSKVNRILDLWCANPCMLENEKIATTPVSTVPFLRDPNFVERSEYNRLTEKLSSGRTRVALTGFGGAGYV
jgi:hypothetical protein